MKAEIFKCPCGEVYFADPAEPNPCPNCGKKNAFPLYLKTYRYNLPVSSLRSKLYACHTEKDSDDFLTVTGECGPAGDGFEVKNVSSADWFVTVDGETTPVKAGASAALKKGMSINFGGGTAEVI